MEGAAVCTVRQRDRKMRQGVRAPVLVPPTRIAAFVKSRTKTFCNR
jgi:hypothetical protein